MSKNILYANSEAMEDNGGQKVPRTKLLFCGILDLEHSQLPSQSGQCPGE